MAGNHAMSPHSASTTRRPPRLAEGHAMQTGAARLAGRPGLLLAEGRQLTLKSSA
jgi:hypothetical protein